MSRGSHHAADESATRTPEWDGTTPGKIHVCHIASGDRWAGAEVQIATLLKYLAADKDISLSAIVLNPGRLADEIDRLGIRSTVIPEKWTGFIGILRQAASFLRGRETHVLHSHRYKENLLATLLARRVHVPVLIRTQHGLIEPHKGFRNVKQTLLYSFDRLTARWAADRVIGVSMELSERLGQELGTQKVISIPNGIDINQVRSHLSVAEARQRLGIAPGACVLGAASRLEPVKRLDIFLQAAHQISHHYPQARFVIAGEGKEEVRLRGLARQLGIQEQVLFLGHRDDVFDVLRAFDILVISSDHEGLPMVVLEAMALGLVVVARDVGGMAEVLTDGVTGILVPSDSCGPLAAACLKAFADEGWRQRMGMAAQKLVAQKFSAERTGAQVAQLYRALVGPQ